MADLESTAYSVGDSVTVTASDGTTYDGTVEKVSAEITTVLIEDDGRSIRIQCPSGLRQRKTVYP